MAVLSCPRGASNYRQAVFDSTNCLNGFRFDIESFDFATDDEAGMLRTVGSLNQLITAEVDAGIPAERIVIGGFSQGGAMSLLTGLTTERRLGGVAVMSGWLPLKNKFKAVSLNRCGLDIGLVLNITLKIDDERPRKEDPYLLGPWDPRPAGQVQVGGAVHCIPEERPWDRYCL